MLATSLSVSMLTVEDVVKLWTRQKGCLGMSREEIVVQHGDGARMGSNS